ncbi:MAG: hypothetical protein QM538_04130 [Methylacidiphilales bacterium]|nr:hypothetical protein [Candidatus Methylacidiphilales bacterium]
MTKRMRGRITYLSKKPERLDAIRGREDFLLTEQADGVIVLHSHSEIDDAPSVLRDVMIAYNGKTGKPLQCSVRLTVGGTFEGCGFMYFTDQEANCQTFHHRDGVLTQKIALSKPIAWLVAHQIIGDGLLTILYQGEEPGKQPCTPIMLTSPDHRGATGPMLFPLQFSLRLVGKETIKVGAGTFESLHFRLEDTGAGGLPEEHPPYDMWVTNDRYRMYLKGGVGGYMQTYYELTELNTEES